MTRTDRLAALAMAGVCLAACRDHGRSDPQAEPSPSTAATMPPEPSPSAKTERGDCCMGLNDCRGKGGCAVPESHACAGQNACKGQGGCRAHCPK